MELPKEDNSDLIHTGAKALLNLVPLAGGPAAEIFDLLVTPPIEKRRKEWMRAVVEALKKIEDNQAGIVQNLADNEEFASLLITASINAYKTHLKDKHSKLRNVLINSVRSEIPFDIKQVYVNFVDQLSLQHLEVLKFISDFEARIKGVDGFQKIYNILTEGTIDPTVPRMSRLEITTFRFLLKDLEAKGLVFISESMEDLEQQVKERSVMLLENSGKDDLPFIRITDFGRTFLKFIQSDE